MQPRRAARINGGVAAAGPTSKSKSSDLAIDLAHVEKVYRSGLRGKVRALRGVAMRVGRGEIYGLLGPNGAGKSTLVKSMMTVVRPTRAEGTVLGRPVGEQATLRRVGYLPESHRFPRYLTGRQVLDLFGALQGVGRRERRKKADELLEIVGMTAWADRRITRYSKGMSQRVGLAQALMASPELVVLDEPTDGVDPLARRQIRDVLARLRDEGKTVFVNSHLLGELELVCDRVGIMVGGEIAREGTVDELSLDRRGYEIEVEGDFAGVRTALGMDRPGGQIVPGAVELDPPIIRLPGISEAAVVQPLLDRLRAAGLTIARVQAVRPTLEELFLDVVGDNALAAGAS